MNGQWLGKYSGTNSGSIIVNIDDMGDHYTGVAFLIVDANPQFPAVVALIKTTDKAKKFKFKTPGIGSFNPQNYGVDTWANVQKFFPTITAFPQEAEVKGFCTDKHLSLQWKTNIGTTGAAKLEKTKAHAPSQLTPKTEDWEGFKTYVSNLEKRRFLFRGQDILARLRTRFHRTGRADLGRFLSEDIQTLYRHLSSRTRHIYNLAMPDQNGAFFNLVQHHGYPTPLLDWAYSPYVAAFFAYRTISNAEAEKGEAKTKHVRLYIFDQQQWHQDFQRIVFLNLPTPNFAIMEFMAIDNERMIPQQAASSLSNVDDIETYIKQCEELKEKTYLQAVDLPIRERRKIMGELAYMGITAGALFPGLDGVCEELRERSFDI